MTTIACDAGAPAPAPSRGAPPPVASPGAPRPPAPGAGAAAYHETSWDAVTARALSHLAAAGRDLARASALAQDWRGCERAYGALAERLAAATPAGDAGRIVAAYAGAARRDAQLCGALAEGRPPPVPSTPFAAFRVALLADPSAAAAPPPPPEVAEHAAEPAARLALRAALTEAWADSVDPLTISDPWGRWTPAWVGAEAERLRGVTVAPGAWSITVEELAVPPTGDVLVDCAGLPGPRALAPGAPVPAPAVAALADELATAPPAAAPGVVAAARAAIAAGPDGARAERAALGGALRALARAGAWAPAAELVAAWRAAPPRDEAALDQDAALAAVEGRLLLLAGDAAGPERLRAAWAGTEAFLARVPR